MAPAAPPFATLETTIVALSTRCETALVEFLESKRHALPRFYFVSTKLLLKIISNGSRPWVVRWPVLPACHCQRGVLQDITPHTPFGCPQL